MRRYVLARLILLIPLVIGGIPALDAIPAAAGGCGCCEHSEPGAGGRSGECCSMTPVAPGQTAVLTKAAGPQVDRSALPARTNESLHQANVRTPRTPSMPGNWRDLHLRLSILRI